MGNIRVLHVDNDAAFLERFSTQISNKNERFDIFSEQRLGEAINCLNSEQQPIECIVSSCVFSDKERLELLRIVRNDHPHLPFIILTGKENGPTASDAISAGATDYLQKGDGEETYEILANRIERFADQYQSQRERDRVYRALETATEGIGLIDKHGEYIYMNDAYAELYDYDLNELIGEHWEQLYPDDEVERFYDKILPKLRREGTWSGRSLGKRATGDVFSEELSLTNLADGGHVCVVRDISERIERDQQFETLTDTLQGMVYRAENTSEWPIEFAHGNVEEFLGYTISDLESQRINWNELIHPDDRQAVWDSVQAAVNSSERFEITYRVIDADGRTKWVTDRGQGVEDDNGTVRTIDGLITDITDRKRYEEELEWKTKAMDEAPMGIVISDPSQDDNPLTYANDGFTEVTGYSKEEVLGRNCRFLQGPLTEQEPVEEIREAIDRRETVEVDVLNYRKEKDPFWNHVQISPIMDADGQLTHFVGFQNDVTSRVERQRRMEILHRVLLHNIRNNLNIILGNIDHLRDQPDLADKTITAIRSPAVDLLESSEKARQIDSWLDDASFHPEELNIEYVLDEALAHGGAIIDEVRTETNVDSDCDVLASESIIIALGELVENAIEHSTETQPSVAITTETDVVTFPRKQTETDAVVIHLDDTNAPISELDQTRLLGNKESPVHHGTGLGLWLVNWLVTMSGGLIEYSRRDERGNRISITLLQRES